MKKQSFMMGSALLVLSVIITKLIGAFFKIPLANMLGGTGLSYFNCAYAIFLPVYAISITGLPTAVSRMVAENAALGKYKNVRKIRKAALIGFSVIGLFCTILITVLAVPFSKYVQNEKALPALLAMAPCIFFGAVMSVYRGYYEGLRNMTPTAVSQVAEALAKLICGLGFAILVTKYADYEYTLGNTVFGVKCTSRQQLLDVSLPYMAAAAILGVTFSSVVACVYLVVRNRIKGDGITEAMLVKDKSEERLRTLFKSLMIIVFPIALGSAVTNLTSVIDLATITRLFKKIMDSYPDVIYNQYSNVMSETVTSDKLPNFIYGSFTGLAITIFNLIPSLTSMFGKGILPSLAEAWTVNDKKTVNKNVTAVVFITSLIAIPAGIGLFVLAEPVLNLLYFSRPAEVAVSLLSMKILGLGVIFLSISIPCFAILQATGHSALPVKIMFIGVIIKLAANIILMSVPEINIAGAAAATTICYLVICIISLINVSKLTKTKFDFSKIFIKPSFAAILCGATAYLSDTVLSSLTTSRITVLISIACGACVYILALFLLNVTDKNGIKAIFFK